MVMVGMEDIYRYTLMEFTLTVIILYPLEVDHPYSTSMYFKDNQSRLDTTPDHGLQRIIIGYMQDQTQQVRY